MLRIENFNTIHVLNCLFEPILEVEVISDDVADALVLHRVIHLEFVQKLTSLTVKKTLPLQILLVVVHFQLIVLQEVLFPINYVLQLLKLLLDNCLLRIVLILHVLDNLRKDEFLGASCLHVRLELHVACLQKFDLTFELRTQLGFERG